MGAAAACAAAAGVAGGAAGVAGAVGAAAGDAAPRKDAAGMGCSPLMPLATDPVRGGGGLTAATPARWCAGAGIGLEATCGDAGICFGCTSPSSLEFTMAMSPRTRFSRLTSGLLCWEGPEAEEESATPAPELRSFA